MNQNVIGSLSQIRDQISSIQTLVTQLEQSTRQDLNQLTKAEQNTTTQLNQISTLCNQISQQFDQYSASNGASAAASNVAANAVPSSTTVANGQVKNAF